MAKDEVTAVSQILEVDGEKAVEISLFYEEKLKGRYFADAENHNVWVNGKWYTCRLKNAIRLCEGLEPLKNDYYYFLPSVKWTSGEDEERVEEFLGAWSIESYENDLNEKKYKKAIERKVERIAQQMADMPCVPDEVEAWVEQTIFPENILFFKKTGKRTTYSCTACGCSSWKKQGWKHGQKTICPKCGRPVTANSRQKKRVKTEPVVLLQPYGKNWVERQFKAVCKWESGTKEIQLFEQLRAIIPNGKCWGKVWYGLSTEADELTQSFWDTNPGNKRFVLSYLYPGNLQEVLPCGRLEQSGMELLARSGKKVNVNKFITTFHQRPYLEYLIKAGLNRMAAEVVNVYGWWREPDKVICTTANNLRDALQLDGNRVSRMKQLDGGLCTLEWLQYEEEKEIKISQESLEYLTKMDIGPNECEEILVELRSVNRMVNYMRKQKIAPKQLTTTWQDYLRMAKEAGYDTTDDIVRLPKDLKARHDYLVELGNKEEDSERLKKYADLDQQIQKRLPDVKKYFWEDKKYMIIPAGACKELMTEGRKLHHCVGRDDHYMKKMAEGKSWILFLRKKEDLKQPYYTIEIDMADNEILQYYSEFDRKPDIKAVNRILNKFKRSVQQDQQKVRIRVQPAAIA
jgi:hypothetical protein